MATKKETFGHNEPTGGPPISRDTPFVLRTQSASGAFKGAEASEVVNPRQEPHLHNMSGVGFETRGDDLIPNVQRRINNAALLSTTGEFAPPFPPSTGSTEARSSARGELTLTPEPVDSISKRTDLTLSRAWLRADRHAKRGVRRFQCEDRRTSGTSGQVKRNCR